MTTIDAALASECPTCGAPVGLPCFTTDTGLRANCVLRQGAASLLRAARAKLGITPDVAAALQSVEQLMERRVPRIVVILHGGLVQDIIADAPVEVVVLDGDIEGAEEDIITPDLPEWNRQTDFIMRWWGPEIAELQVQETFTKLPIEEG